MKRILLFALVLICSVFAYSQTNSTNPKVIVDPAYEVKGSGISNVVKIELSDTETRLTIHSTFVPYWWISFTKKEDVIRDPKTGKIYEITGIEGAELDQQTWMKGSGDSTIVLIYPPLDKGVQKIDYADAVFGISLDQSKAGKHEMPVVPAAVSKWLKESLAKVKRNAPMDFNSPKFFTQGTARLIGYIKGYDTRLGFTTGLVYTTNDLTREDYPTVVQIHPDGRFEADLPYEFPKCSSLNFNNVNIPFYLEPGQTLSMIVDWEEFLIADRMRNIRYQFKNVIYQGPLAKVNTDLAGFTPDPFDYNLFQTKMGTMAPEEFKIEQLLLLKTNQQKVEDYIKSNNLSPQAASIARNKTLLESADHLFDFVMNRRYKASKDTANQVLKIPVTLAYYDFLKDIPMNDNGLLVSSEFGTFINRFEYCEPLSRAIPRTNLKNIKPKKDFFTFILESGVEISAEDKEVASLLSKEDKTEDEKRILETKKELIKNFTEKHKDQVTAYVEKYISPLSKLAMAKNTEDSWHLKDSVLRSDLGLEPSLVYEITKVRSLNFVFETFSSETANEFWSHLKTGITNPYLIETGNLLYKKSFPEDKTTAYTLPKGPATDIFKKIIDPYKGKILFIDFWATTCGPCVSGIQSMKSNREKYADNKDFDFIFITDERSSPLADYTKFVKEQGMKNIYRLSVDDYNHLRQLFKFNGIPHYTVIDQQGNVLSNNFQMHNFRYELPHYLPKYSPNYNLQK
ncbi:MAG TPA: TlpA disulfide reductase family protein [Prolixibacteraceae bacterium]|jgi:thiol-disulfide isomerase/thioredoxin